MLHFTHFSIDRTLLFRISFILIFLVGIGSVQAQEIYVNIEPEEAIDLGAQWRLYNAEIFPDWSEWYNSGFGLEVPPNRTYLVGFKTIDGWQKPSDWEVYVTGINVYTHTGTYIKTGIGSLLVNIYPEEVRKNARWKIHGKAGWYKSGDKVNLIAGEYLVEFNNIRGFITPDSIRVTITQDITKNKQATYSPLIVGKVRIIGDILKRSGNTFTAQGNIRLAFAQGSSSADVSDVSYTDEAIKITGLLSGTFNPPRINGSGGISCTSPIPLFDMKTFYKGSYTINANTLEIKQLNFKVNVKFMGCQFYVKRFKFKPNPFCISMGIDLILPPPVFVSGARIQIERLDLEQGKLPVVVGEARLKDCDIFGWIYVKDTYLKIDITTQSFSANLDIALDNVFPPLRGHFEMVNGKLAQIMIAVEGMNINVPPTPIYLQDLGFDLRNPTTNQGSVHLNLRLTVFPEYYLALIELDGALDIYFDGRVKGTTNQRLLGFKTGSASIYFHKNEYFKSDFYASLVLGLLKIKGWCKVLYKPAKFYGSASGTVGFSVPKWLRWLVGKSRVYIGSTSVSILKDGFHARAKILKISVSVHFPTANRMSADFFPEATTTVLVEERVFTEGFSINGDTYVVKENTPVLVFTGISELKMPFLVLIQPDGKKIDPKAQLPSESENFMYREDTEDKVASFLIGQPMPGTWTVKIKNAGQAGETKIYFYKGNNDPQLVPEKVEKISDYLYKIYLKAYDPDNKALVTFYWDDDNSDFDGFQVGTANEKDGALIFNWVPEENLVKSGYLYAEIDDGVNPLVHAYFEENIHLAKSVLPAPILKNCRVIKDKLVLNLKLQNPEQMNALKIYYSDNLKQKVLTDYTVAQVESKIELREGPIKAGRRYQFKVAAIDNQGAETEISIRKKIKYKAKIGNNYPFFKSEPILYAEPGKEYIYAFKAVDWDKDALTFTLDDGPEEMTLDNATRTIRWTPKDDDAGHNFVSIGVSDGKGGTDNQVYTLMVSTPTTPFVNARTTSIRTETGPELLVEIRDPQADEDSSIQDELEVTIADKNGYEKINLLLHETSADSGIFRGMYGLITAGYRVPYWFVSKPYESSPHELIVSWITQTEIAREVRTVLH
jgi:hypothetical protein